MNARAEFPARAKLRVLPDDWDMHHDNRLRDTGGVYSKVAVLSDEWGIAETALITRWHKLRGRSGVDRSVSNRGKGKSSAGKVTGGRPPRRQDVENPQDLPRPELELVRDVASDLPRRQQNILLVIAGSPGLSCSEIGREGQFSSGSVATSIPLLRRHVAASGWSIVTAPAGGYYLVEIS
ncbi:hypothetical protein FIU89_11245 [Roseovarius sp. THAF27]|uniref:hypothetical protein n=1 Tax=Roseovarius sp. THAF27 TaxID=2587850 RepID=UPI0012692E01|nr:hypothetical protein [Roseovarius sp. THAF27]QFT81185.1 hypothetical protein FIU89_11245 [Roseovarius sp. THAF27]